MYNSFPNWSYAFYLSDQDGKLIPSYDVFKVSGGWLGHTFASVCQDKNINYGHNVESEEELNIVGKQMMDMILEKNVKNAEKFKQINLHKIDFKLVNYSIVKTDKIIYERHLP